MKMQVTFDDSSTFGKKDIRRITLEGGRVGALDELIEEYFRIVLIAMGFNGDAMEIYYKEHGSMDGEQAD
jgi:hypothetical protein